jgi:hypothetical protein
MDIVDADAVARHHQVHDRIVKKFTERRLAPPTPAAGGNTL